MGVRSRKPDGGVDPGLVREELTRRALLMRGAGAGAALSAGAVLAACGGSSSSSSSAATGSATGAASASTGSAAAPVTDVPASVVTELKSILAPPTGKAAGQALALNIGYDGSLSGAGTVWGIPMFQGAKLALQHIKALGGPDYKLTALDSHDTGTGTTNTRQFGSMGIPAILTSQGGGAGGGVPFYPRYQMFAIDSGGANSLNVARPFLYQGRSLWGIGSMDTMIAYQKVKRPNIKKVGILGSVFVGTGYAQLNPTVISDLKNAGYDVVAQVYPPTATTDFAPFITALQRADPDIIVMPTTEGVLNSALLKQAEGLGLTQPIVAIDYDRAWAVNAPPTAVSKYEFAFDYFDSNNPPTQWGKLFVQEYQRVYKEYPDYYAANYYESAFLVWTLVQRIIAAGEDPSKTGPNYVNAFAKNPSFVSVYSATTGAPHGMNTFSTSGHTVVNRPTAYGHGNPDGSGTVLANALQTGAQFKFTAAGQAVPVSQ